jgi:DNA-binding XRE family transcriptional regulator
MDKEDLIKRINDLDDNAFMKFTNIAIQVLDLLDNKIKPLSPNDSIAERLKNARHQKGLTQEKLSRSINVARSVIGEIESGRRKNASRQLAKKLSEFFNTDISYWY